LGERRTETDKDGRLIDLSGKVALVTGGSRGIGAATARLLAQAGAGVALTYRTRREEAEAVARAAAGQRGSVADSTSAGPPVRRSAVYQLDLASPEAHARVTSAVLRDFGVLDYYIANAGIWPQEEVPVRDMTDARWAETMRVNLDAVFFGCRAALKVMRPGGSIVIVTSTAGQRGEAFHADYAATKGALIAFVKSLAVEAAPAITVNSVAPGWVDTDMCTDTYAEDGGKGRERIEAGIPLRRVATPEDIAGPIVFLCSPLARHITGEVLNVNGGAVLCG
jgi:3-oxoacyl-[acyl-carrier protein] reductase